MGDLFKSTRSLHSVHWLEHEVVGMAPMLKVAVFLLLIGFAYASRIMDDFSHCEKIVKRWAISSLEQEAMEDKDTLKDLLFYLHIPRTGGRTYYHCLLRRFFSNYQECPRSYDKLRFDPSKQECRLLSTHDDYSMMSKLPKERTSVVTILRNPVDRVFSTYEFSIEVAARFLIHPNLTSATRMTGRIRARPGGVSTLDIWPWKYLVPWMREDLFSRREAREVNGLSNMKSNDPYNMKEMVMPLHQYINDPMAHDIVHNGATFQVAGLTNNSYTPEAHEVRHCVQKYKILGEDVLTVAKKRLDNMLYVGLTENHEESATIFANVVGAQVISQALSSNSSMESTVDKRPEQKSAISDSEVENDDHQIGIPDQKPSEAASKGNLKGEKENMTVDKLLNAYESCVTTLRKSHSKRRASSLKRIAPANFSKQDRLRVSESVIKQIKALNSLDLELYEYGLDLFAKQQKETVHKLGRVDAWESFFDNTGGIEPWKILSMAMSVAFLLLILFLFVNARRRTFKIKI